MKKNTLSQNLLQQYRAAYSGAAWHGPNIHDTLSGIKAKGALKHLNGSKNIAELVLHMIAWRQFALRKLAGETDFDIIEEEQNFPPVPQHFDDRVWRSIQQQFKESQEALENHLATQEEGYLAARVSGRNYNFLQLLNGVLQHDLYHQGQIVLLAKYA